MIPKTLHKEWVELLRGEFDKPYFSMIVERYRLALKQGNVLPPSDRIFYALNLTPPSRVRVVILGQDPYHGSKSINGIEVAQAMGLSFSVPRALPLPPSLRNIYKELESSLGLTMPGHGDLCAWAQRGALLLNAILSVEKHKAASHRWIGWESFSDAIITALSENFSQIVFMLWGAYAQKKSALIDTSKHCVIESPHPSPLARGFLGSGVFTRAKEAWQKWGLEEFDWHLE